MKISASALGLAIILMTSPALGAEKIAPCPHWEERFSPPICRVPAFKDDWLDKNWSRVIHKPSLPQITAMVQAAKDRKIYVAVSGEKFRKCLGLPFRSRFAYVLARLVHCGFDMWEAWTDRAHEKRPLPPAAGQLI